MQEYMINCEWDSEANVWIASSNDVPGLVLESGSIDALIERVKFAVPELLELNKEEHKSLLLFFKSERREQVFG